MTGRRIVTRHLLRRTARMEQHHLERLQAKARRGNPQEKFDAEVELRAVRVTVSDLLHVERAGRVRARWVVARGVPVSPAR